MHIIGITIGWIIAAGCFLAVMNYFVKFIYRKEISKIPIDSSFRSKYLAFMKIVVKNHAYIGLYLVTLIFLYLFIELVHEGFFVTGLITGGLMLFQLALGAYGKFSKHKLKSLWLYFHRTIAALLMVALFSHILDSTTP